MLKKSLLFLVLTSIVGILSAQSLQFGSLNEDGEFQAYANNTKIVCETAPSSIGEMVLEDVAIKNTTSSTIDVVVEKEEVQLVEGTETSICWGLGCYSADVYITRPYPMDGGVTSSFGQLSFHYQVDPTYSGDPNECIPGTTIVKYYTYPFDNPEDKSCLEVWFVYNATNVVENTIDFGQAYPNPASNQVYFDVKSNDGSSIKAVVYNLLGQEVKSIVANGLQSKIKIDLNDVQPGIYFCSFYANDEVLKTEKFIVKK